MGAPVMAISQLVPRPVCACHSWCITEELHQQAHCMSAVTHVPGLHSVLWLLPGGATAASVQADAATIGPCSPRA